MSDGTGAMDELGNTIILTSEDCPTNTALAALATFITFTVLRRTSRLINDLTRAHMCTDDYGQHPSLMLAMRNATDLLPDDVADIVP
jgi:hypothetical protein